MKVMDTGAVTINMATKTKTKITIERVTATKTTAIKTVGMGMGMMSATTRLCMAGTRASGAAWQLYVPLTPPANSSLLLRPGYSTRRIAAELKRAGVIRSELVFGLWHGLHPKPSLKAGEYRFERAASLPQVYERIARGDIYFHVVTIPEGYTMFDIAKAMEDAGLGPAADFLPIAKTQTPLTPE